MRSNDNTEKQTNKEKKGRTKFHVSTVGVVIYSVVLIAVIVVSYVGVKTILRNYDNMVAAAAAKETEAEEAKAEESAPSPTATPTPTPQEEVPADHNRPAEELTDPDTGEVDYSKEFFKPGKRNKDLKWKDTVFSRIENVKDPAAALVNTFDYRRVSVPLPENRSSEYRIYSDPETGEVVKITEIEDCGEIHKILDYYYDEGNINYIDEYRVYIDCPIDISSAGIESRYYFRNDCLVRYIYCKNQNATEYNVADIDSYSSGTVDQYDYLEKDMINRAYIVYNVAPSIKETEVLYGYVMDEFSMPMEDAKIVVKSESDDRVIAESTTDGDGYYKIAIDCTDDETYCVTAGKDTLNEESVFGITAYSGSGKYAVEPIYLGYTNNTASYSSQFVVRDATDPNKPLSGAGIMIRKGLNDRTGDVVQTGELDDNGTANVMLPSGSYTAEITKGGYETLFMSVIIRPDHQFAVGFAMPDVEEDTYRVVVSWESAPLDLNAMAISSYRAQIFRSSVDSLGLTTAETVTINNAGTDDYRFYVTDFGSITSADVMSYNMTGSCAYADVYNSDGLVANFHVPVASSGVVWEAFEIRNKKVLPVNSYFYAVDDDSLWKTK